ncbi:toxin-antitoxin system TumE family protein [Azospirillum sp.]|uniref:toxin-antitoxin system TumE family protein n=1 Tax=Azospirillum sp. TaxID=34012 RepID=UPI003D75B46D
MPKARLLRDRKMILADGGIVQIRVWEVLAPVPPSEHRFKYALYYGKGGERLVGYDNERGKGDHKHIKGLELPYMFIDIETLLADFVADVEALRGEQS